MLIVCSDVGSLNLLINSLASATHHDNAYIGNVQWD